MTTTSIERARTRFLNKLPERIRCPHCNKLRAKDQFGVRLMNKPQVEAGEEKPLFRKQSFCTPCRS